MKINKNVTRVGRETHLHLHLLYIRGVSQRGILITAGLISKKGGTGKINNNNNNILSSIKYIKIVKIEKKYNLCSALFEDST